MTTTKTSKTTKTPTPLDEGWLVRVLRSFLYEGYQCSEGLCPETLQCVILTQAGKKGKAARCRATNSCPRRLVPEEPPVPPEFLPWLKRIFRLDSMRQVGCVFHMNDLPHHDWTALIAVARERNRMDGLVREARDRVHAKDRERTPHSASAEQALTTARKRAGVPAAGQSIFGRSPK